MDEAPVATRVLIGDDHRIYREGLSQLLSSQPDLVVVGQAGTTGETIRLAQQLHPDILLLDLGMALTRGMEMLRELSELADRVRVILIASQIEHADILTALQLGARGVITKEEDSEILFRSIRKVMAGEYWISRASVGDLVAAVRSLMIHAKRARTQQFRITPRQHEIIGKVIAGLSNREIAQQFSLSEETVKRHLTHIFDKLGVSNRLELALFALHHGLNQEP